MRILLNEAKSKIIISSVKGFWAYDIAKGSPKLMKETLIRGVVPFFSRDRAAEPIAGNTGSFFARMWTQPGQGKHWSRSHTTISCYNWDTLNEVHSVVIPNRLDPNSLAVSPDGKSIAVVIHGGAVMVIDVASGKTVATGPKKLRHDSRSGISWSNDGKLLAIGETSQGTGDVVLLDATDPNLEIVSSLPRPKNVGLDDAPFYSKFSQDDKYVMFSNMSWGGSGMLVYDVARKKLVFSVGWDPTDELEPEQWYACAVDAIVNNTFIVTGGTGCFLAWKLKDGKELPSLPAGKLVRKHFAVETSKQRIWYVKNRKPCSVAIPKTWG